MITRISQKEFKRLENQDKLFRQLRKFTLFTGINGMKYKCDQTGPEAMKEIWQLQRKLKKEKESKLSLLD